MSSTLANQPRHRNHREQFLALLRSKPYVTCDELMAISRSHTRRITDLRQQGHLIDVQIDAETGATRYTYRGHGEPHARREASTRGITRTAVVEYLAAVSDSEWDAILRDAEKMNRTGDF